MFNAGDIVKFKNNPFPDEEGTYTGYRDNSHVPVKINKENLRNQIVEIIDNLFNDECYKVWVFANECYLTCFYFRFEDIKGED